MDLTFREADGLKIRFAEAGQRGSETVVLTSPWPESIFAFRKVWDRLAERFHVLAIDLPGYGRSERQFELYSTIAMGGFLVQLVKEWDLGPVHFVAPDVGTPATLWAAANEPALVRSLVIGGGATTVPLQVEGALKDLIEAPDLEGIRQIDSKDILGPIYDAIPGGETPPEVRADYLESYAGDRFVESARYVRTYPTDSPSWRRSWLALRRPPRLSPDAMTPSCPRSTRSSCTTGCRTTGWIFFLPRTTRGRKCPICMRTC